MSTTSAFIIRRIPLAAMHRNVLALGLGCSHCGHTFTIKNYKKSGFVGRTGKCPKCGVEQHLRPSELRRVLEKSFRAAATRIERRNGSFWTDALSVTIANSAILLEPILKVVLVNFRADRIGHYILNTSMFLARLRKAGYSEALLFAIPRDPQTESNHWLGNKWNERFISTPAVALVFHSLEQPMGLKGRLRRIRQKALRRLHRGDYHKYALLDHYFYDHSDFPHALDLDRYTVRWHCNADLTPDDDKIPFHFSEKEKSEATQWFIDHNVPTDKPYVCFLGRDFSYLDSRHPSMGNVNSSQDKKAYDRYRFRNMDIQTYLPAMEWVAGKGGTPIRMGSVVAERLNTNDSRIIDYPFHGRNEFMDLYLAGNCLFYVSSGTGPDIFASWVGKWLLLVNYPNFFEVLFDSTDYRCIAPKKKWSHQKQRFLSIQEAVRNRLDVFASYEEALKQGIELVDNTPQEICAAVKEVWARATGHWVTTDAELAMQEKYRKAMTDIYGKGLQVKPMLSYSFYLMNSWLLEDN